MLRRYWVAREKIFALIGAGIAFSLAFLILWQAGLPDPLALLAVTPGETPAAPLIGAAAPPFTGITSRGDTIALAELRGAPVILNFWATWCGPCAAEMPDLQAVYEARKDEGLHVLAINVDEPPAVFVPWAAERGLTFDLLPDQSRTIQMLYQLRGLPQTFLIGSDGVIREIFYGPVDLRRLENTLDSAAHNVSDE